MIIHQPGISNRSSVVQVFNKSPARHLTRDSDTFELPQRYLTGSTCWYDRLGEVYEVGLKQCQATVLKKSTIKDKAVEVLMVTLWSLMLVSLEPKGHQNQHLHVTHSNAPQLLTTTWALQYYANSLLFRVIKHPSSRRPRELRRTGIWGKVNSMVRYCRSSVQRTAKSLSTKLMVSKHIRTTQSQKTVQQEGIIERSLMRPERILPRECKASSDSSAEGRIVSMIVFIYKTSAVYVVTGTR